MRIDTVETIVVAKPYKRSAEEWSKKTKTPRLE
jgi:hypothetical protein